VLPFLFSFCLENLVGYGEYMIKKFPGSSSGDIDILWPELVWYSIFAQIV
jgi:hypothetical protein